MANLWDYINNTAKSMPVGAIGLAKLASEPARFVGNAGKSVYDSFKRGIQPPQFGEDLYLRQQQNVEDAFNVLGGTMTGGLPFAPKGGASTLGTLKHIGATTYSDLLANIAKKDLLEGRMPEEVWHKTGYHPLGSILDANYAPVDFPAGIQGEIADTGTGFNASKLNTLLKHVNATGLPEQIEMSSIVKHPELFKNYPSLKQEPLTFLPKTAAANASRAWYQPASKRGNGNIFLRDRIGGRLQYESFLHELDHKLMFEAPESAGLYGLTDMYATPMTNLEYMNQPHESTARMREARYLGKNKEGNNPPYVNKSDLKNSPFFDLAIQRYGAWPKELAPWLSKEQRSQVTNKFPPSLGNRYSTDWLTDDFFGKK